MGRLERAFRVCSTMKPWGRWPTNPGSTRPSASASRIRRAGRKLVRLGTKVNFVWNYCNDVSKRSAQRVGPWVGKKQLIDLTKGSSKEIGLPSQIVQNVVFEFIKSRKAAGKPKLPWRVSRGAKRSLGWVPFTNQDVTLEGGRGKLRGETFRLWMHRELTGRIKSGNFSQDSRGRWYCNLVCEVEAPKTTNRTKVVGIDLGFKTVASSSDGRDLEQANFYRDLEAKLADAQRRNKKRLVKTIHAKIKNRRKDALHKYSRAVVNDAGAVFVGNISSTWQVASGNGKAALDVSWSMLKNFLRYKCDQRGCSLNEVPQRETSDDKAGTPSRQSDDYAAAGNDRLVWPCRRSRGRPSGTGRSVADQRRRQPPPRSDQPA